MTTAGVTAAHGRAYASTLFLLVLLGSAGCASRRPLGPADQWFTQRTFPVDGQNPFGVAVADLNSDGRLDLAVTNAASDSVAVLLATTDSGFTKAPGWPVRRVARGVVATDLNGDRRADIVAAGGLSNRVEVFLSDGRGGADHQQYQASLAPFNVDVADLNGDGALDVVVANESNIRALEGKGEVSVLLGDGRGGLGPQRIYEADSYPADVKVADLNGDGRLDLAVINWKSRDVSLFFGVGDGTFGPVSQVPYGGAAGYSLAVGDVNGDGATDIVLGDLLGVVYVLHNDGRGGFAVSQRLAAGGGTRCVILVDLNGDRALDIVTANTAAGTVTVLLAQPAGGFAAPYQITVGKLPRVVTAADLNGDGATDLVVTNGGSNDLSVLMNNGIGG